MRLAGSHAVSHVRVDLPLLPPPPLTPCPFPPYFPFRPFLYKEKLGCEHELTCPSPLPPSPRAPPTCRPLLCTRRSWVVSTS